jgi:integrase
MASVFKTAGNSKYTIFYTDENGRRRKKAGTTDKAVSERIAHDLENKAALRKQGLIDPKAESFRDHEARPLVEHLNAFQRALASKGGSKRYPEVTCSRTRKFLELAKVRRISDLSLSKAQAAVQSLRDEGLSIETINHHIRAVKGFSRWLWRDGRAREHHLAHLSTSNPEAGRRRIRRALTPEEAVRVIQAAEIGPPFRGLSGLDRAVLYVLALGTGFRADELRTLTPERFSLNSNPPTVTASACYTKNGKEAVQPVSASLAEQLRPWLARLAPGKPVFGRMTTRTADMLRADLEAAGVPYETASGVVDFHSLRGCYITYLIASGASVKTCQTLARHSTAALTIGIYAKASLHDISGAVERLPDLTADHAPRDAMAATGTDGVSGPSATEFATHPLVILTQDDGTQDNNVVASKDLSSPDRESSNANATSPSPRTFRPSTEGCSQSILPSAD